MVTRRIITLSLAFTLMTGLALGAVPQKPPVVRKVLIIALGRDAARSTEIENAIQNNFQSHGVTAESAHTETPRSLTIDQIIQKIEAKHYDAVLCMGPRPTIRLQPSSTEMPDLKTCLTTYTTGKRPTGEALEVNPYSTETSARAASTASGADTLKSPIQTNANAATFTLFKGTLRLFEATSCQPLWQKDVSAKVPVGSRHDIETTIITYNIWEAVEKSGILPTNK
jgi:hypothetical protein